ncbi:MAG: hypothetical protein WEE66_02385 [Actinomycetota bacterium]
MRLKLLSIVVGVATCVMPFTGVANAGTRADTTVTIRTENGDFWGFVNSPRPLRCAEGRKVVLFKQTGPEQDPRVDERIASDTASLNGDRYQWNTGNTGMFGRFYARVGKTEFCKGDTSKTVRSVRP